MDVRDYTAWESIWAALADLQAYFLLAALIALVAALASVLSGSLLGSAAGKSSRAKRRRLFTEFLSLALYCLCFTVFGTVTSYFLAQGLTDDGVQVSNSLIANFVAPFVALLTGAVTYVATKTHLSVSKSDVVLGVVCFLLACVFSYEAFKIKKSKLMVISGSAATQQSAPRTRPGNEAELDFTVNQAR